MKAVVPVLALLALMACTPKPPIYVLTKSPAEPLAQVKTARLEAQPVAKVDLHDFKRAFVKKYGSELAFLQGFNQEVAADLAQGAAGEAPVYKVELPLLNVDAHVVTSSMMVGAGPTAHWQTTSTEYCDIRLTYQVRDRDGRVVLDGVVTESTAKGEFLHPNQGKLANAVAGVRQHLVDYLRGRMAPENVASLDLAVSEGKPAIQ